MKRTLLSTLFLGLILHCQATLLVQETFDGLEGSGTLQGNGDSAASIGFEPSTIWLGNANNTYAGTALMAARNFNVDSAVTNARPWQTFPGDDNRGGIWWNASTWDTGVWAVRPLAAAAQLNLGVDRVYYLSFNLAYRNDDSLGFGFATGEADTSQFISVGPNWNTTSFNGNQSAKRLAVAYGTLNVGQGVSGANAWSTAQVVNNLNYVVLVKITARAAANDTIQAAFFHTNRAGYGILPANEAQVAWDITHDFADSNVYTHLLAFINGGSSFANLDSFRMGTAYRDAVQIEPLITTQPVPSPAGTVYTGVPVSLGVAARGGAPEPLSFQWYKAASAITGATSASLTLSNPAVVDTGDYYVMVTNSYGIAYSQTNTITILPANPPVIVTDIQPAAPQRYLGGHVTFSAALDGTPPFRLQWKHAGDNIAGATNLSFTIPDLAAADAGDYQLFATNDFGWTSSSPSTLTLLTPVPGSYEAMMVAEKPVAYWRLNEDALPGVSEVGFDYMGGNHLYHTNVLAGASLEAPAFPGLETGNKAAFYDGWSTASATTTGLMNNLGQFTIMGWWNPSTWPQRTALNSERVALFGQNDCAEFGFHGANTIGIWTPNGGYVGFNGATLITPGNWYFIAAVGNGTNVTFYLNGNVAASGGNATTNYGSSTSSFRVGYGVLDASGNEFTGAIDEVAVFDRALSEQQINTLYSKSAGVVAPSLLTQPASDTRYITLTKRFEVTASGTLPLHYQWRKNGQALVEAPNIIGVHSNVLILSNIASAQAGDYEVEVSNTAGAVTSDPAHLEIITPAAGSYEAGLISLGPVGYWRLNEPDEIEVAHDYWGGYAGTYGGSLLSAAGPQGPDWAGFETTNSAYSFVNGTADSWVTLPAMPVNTNTVTFTCWFYSDGDQGNFRGVVFNRNWPPVAGLHFGNGNELRYTWGDQYWNRDSGLIVPAQQWVFAALTVQPDKATIYLGANGQLSAASNVAVHTNQNFGAGVTLIGNDRQDSNPASRVFSGRIDEVAVFGKALTAAEIQSLFNTGSGAVRLEAHHTGTQLILSWPTGVLQQADTVNGTYTDVPGAASPHPVNPAGTKYFRVKVRTAP